MHALGDCRNIKFETNNGATHDDISINQDILKSGIITPRMHTDDDTTIDARIVANTVALRIHLKQRQDDQDIWL